MDAKTISVIVVKCDGILRIYGERIVDASFHNLGHAHEIARTLTGKGKCVIVRPNYNETDADVRRFYREWRSFDGEPLREVRFAY